MVQTRTFRIDALDLATGARLSGNGTISSSAPSTAAEPGGAPAHRGKTQTVPSAPLADVLRLKKLSSRVRDVSKARGGLAGDSGAAEQQRYLVPVIDMANHSTLPAAVNAELRLGAGSSGLRFALVAGEPSGCAARLTNACSLVVGLTA